tara:strand:+ start:328461 stop:328940 length:480 start_codon:yes stop_codon:yes gene_type:complete
MKLSVHGRFAIQQTVAALPILCALAYRLFMVDSVVFLHRRAFKQTRRNFDNHLEKLMIKNKWMTALFTAVMLTAVVGCASTSSKEGTGEYVDDSWITTKVKAAFVKDKTLSAAEINVETFKGTVQLSGFVKDKEDISKAASVARDVKGVKAVKNDLRMK